MIKRQQLLKAINPGWAVNSIVIVAVEPNEELSHCGNLLSIFGPHNHYKMGIGVAVCGGYNPQIGLHPLHKEVLK
jgi:hypothetical protein